MILAKEIDPNKAARAGMVYQGEIPFSDFFRLQDLVHSGTAIRYHWSFYMDNKGQALATLKLKGELSLNCQRCYEAMSIKLVEEVAMQVVETEADAEKLPLSIEPIFVNSDGQCDTTEVIEDELILALPMIAMHKEKDCSFSKNEAYYPAQNEKTTYKPFAALSKVVSSKE